MKFAEIIREAGVIPENFSMIPEIPVTLYDRKDRKVEDENLKFAEDLFANNPVSYTVFYSFLRSLEEKFNELKRFLQTEEFSVKIDEYAVCLFYKTSNCKIFLR